MRADMLPEERAERLKRVIPATPEIRGTRAVPD